MKRFLSTLIVLWCLILPVSALEVPKAPANFFVADFADVISPADELVLQQRAENLYHACGAQVVVVTLESLEGEALEDISLRIARDWGIGDKNKDNGLLLLFSESEERVRIEVGSGLEGAIPDSKAGRILDNDMLPAYPDYSAALSATQSTLVNEVYIEYGLSPAEDYIPIDQRYDYETDEGGGLLSTLFKIAAVVGVIILFIRHPRLLLFFLYFGGRGGRGGGFSGRGGGGGFSGGGGGFSGGGASR